MKSLGGLKLAGDVGLEWFRTRSLGGEPGNGIVLAMWESRMFKVVSWVAHRVEQS